MDHHPGALPPSRRRLLPRAGVVLVGVVGLVLSLGSSPVEADGLDFVCQAVAPTDVAASTVTNAGFSVAATPPGQVVPTLERQDPLTPFGLIPDPATGGPNVDGQFHFVGIDGDAITDADFAWGLRASTAPGFSAAGNLGPNPLQQLFNENLGVPLDYNNPFNGPDQDFVQGLGVDLHVIRSRNSLITQHRLEYGAFVDLVNPSGPNTHLRIRVGFDGRPRPGVPGDQLRRLPDEANISILMRPSGATTDIDFLGVGIETGYLDRSRESGFLPASQHPPLGMSLVVEIVDDSGSPVTGGALVNATINWAKAPGDVALGIRHRCPIDRSVSLSHISLYRNAATTPAAPVDLDLRALGAEGLPVTPGGPRTDVARVVAGVSALPERLDVIMQPESLSVTRSPETAPVITANRITFAADDPTTTGELPLHLSGTLDALPRHVRVVGQVGNSTSTQRAQVTTAELTCTGATSTEPDPSLPLFPRGCTRTGTPPIAKIDLRAQNFVPEDTATAASMLDVAGTPTSCAPSGSAESLSVGFRQDLRADGQGIFQVGTCLRNVTGGGFELPPALSSRPRVSLNIARTAAADVEARVGAVMADGGNVVRIEATGGLAGAPASLTATLMPSTTEGLALRNGVLVTRKTHAVDVAVASSSPVNLTLTQLRVATAASGQTPRTVLRATGQITGVPPHVRVRATTLTGGSPATTSLTQATVEACPVTQTGDPFVPGGGLAPQCIAVPESQRAAGTISIVAQDFDPTDATATTDLPPVSELVPPSNVANPITSWVTAAYRAPRSGLPSSNFLASVRVAGVRRISFDTSGTGTSTNPAFQRTRIVASAELAAPVNEAFVKVVVDGRTSADPTVNTGARISAGVLATPIPARLDATFESVDLPLFTATDTVAAVEWTASGPIALSFPTNRLGTTSRANLRVSGPAPDQLEVNANLTVGTPGGSTSGDVSPDGRVVLTRTEELTAAGTVTRYQLAYSGSQRMRIRGGATVSTATDRSPAGTANDLRTRITAELSLPPAALGAPVTVGWRDRAGTITEIDGNVCTQSSGCPTNRVGLTAHRGKALSDDALLDQAPSFPVAPMMGSFQPSFRSIFPGGPDAFGEGVAAMLLPDGSMFARASLRDIARASAQLDPGITVRLRTNRGTVADPFGISLYAQPMSNIPAVFANVDLANLPADIVIRARTSGGETSDPQPWIWVNTESIDITDPPTLSGATTGTTGPRLTGIVLVGDQSSFAPNLSDIDFAARGVRARGSISVAGGRTDVALRARIVSDVPRHLQLWRPTIRSCGAGADTLSSCATRQSYEAELRTQVNLKARTTTQDFGRFVGAFEIANGPRQRSAGTVEIERIPGSLDLFAQLIRNRRLPWATVRLNQATNVSPGTISATITDRCLPGYTGDTANTPELAQRILPGDCISNPRATNQVPNYSVVLRNVPATVDFRADVAASEAPNQGVPRHQIGCRDSDPLTPGDQPYLGRGPTRLGYLHADLDLDGNVTDIDVDARTSKDDPSEDDNADTTVSFTSDNPVSGSIRARLLNVAQNEAQSRQVADLFGLIKVNASVFACIDFDLPLDLTLTNVRLMKLAATGAKLEISLPATNPGRVDARIRETFTCTSLDVTLGCPAGLPATPITRVGAPFERNLVRLDITGLGPLDKSFVESGRKRKNIGVIDLAEPPGGSCDPADQTDADNCWKENLVTNRIDTNSLGSDQIGSLRRTRVLIDPLWDNATRNDPSFANFWGTDVGAGFYTGLDQVFELPKISPLPTVSANMTTTNVDANVPASGTGTNDARGSDGTTFRVVSTPVNIGGTCAVTTVRVIALHSTVSPMPIRWSRSLGTFNGPCNHRVRAIPDAADGSVTVSVDFAGTGRDRVARFDASGYGRVLSGLTVPVEVRSLTAGNTLWLALPGTAAQPLRPASGNRRVWYLGDGEMRNSPDSELAALVAHRYDRPGRYYALAIDYNGEGVPVAQTAFEVTVTTPIPVVPPPVRVF
jgi:hypothetical protein